MYNNVYASLVFYDSNGVCDHPQPMATVTVRQLRQLEP